MAWKVIWTRRGGLSLEEAYEYVAADDPDAADKLLAGIFESVDLLERFPFIGARYERRGRRTSYREIQHRMYRIFYRVDERQEEVHVILIWHGSRDEPSFSDLR